MCLVDENQWPLLCSLGAHESVFLPQPPHCPSPSQSAVWLLPELGGLVTSVATLPELYESVHFAARTYPLAYVSLGVNMQQPTFAELAQCSAHSVSVWTSEYVDFFFEFSFEHWLPPQFASTQPAGGSSIVLPLSSSQNSSFLQMQNSATCWPYV